MSAISLTKGSSVSLSKEAPGLTKVAFGLGWDPITKKGLFGSRKEDVDLDASVLVFDGNKRLVESVSFRKLRSDDGAIKHSGDNRTGDGDGDDETIIIDLDKLRPDAEFAVFVVNSFVGHTFDMLESAEVNVRNPLARGDDLIATFKLAAKGRYTGAIMGVLGRRNGSWDFTGIGEVTNAQVAEQLAELSQNFL